MIEDWGVSILLYAVAYFPTLGCEDCLFSPISFKFESRVTPVVIILSWCPTTPGIARFLTVSWDYSVVLLSSDSLTTLTSSIGSELNLWSREWVCFGESVSSRLWIVSSLSIVGNGLVFSGWLGGFDSAVTGWDRSPACQSNAPISSAYSMNSFSYAWILM